MSADTPKYLLRKLLLRSSGASRLWAAWLSLCVGTILLLLSLMIWWNFRELLQGKSNEDSLGSSFITISKTVTDDNMGNPKATLFTTTDIAELQTQKQVQEVGALVSNHFPVIASTKGSLGFSTEMFLEAVPDHFIDKRPGEWNWKEGDTQVPIILSTEFLNLYNYGFALSQGLPQLSQTSIKTITFNLTVGEGDVKDTYTGHVTGFSDRITSVLVPESFIQYANIKYGHHATSEASQLILKVKDPSDKEFVDYLQSHKYSTNAEQLRWSKMRAIVDVISGTTGLLALLLMGIGTIVFILFIELTMANAQQSIVLLLQIGYSPRYISTFMLGKFVPLLLSAILIAVGVAISAQIALSIWAQPMMLRISMLLGWPIWLVVIFSAGLLMLQVKKAVVNALKKV
ncbi:MAG: hypothetical protein WCG87_04790 [Bacteroidota bacterium]